MPACLLGRKLGMTRYFTVDGRNIPVTVIEAGPCVVTQVKTTSTDGYPAVQISFDDVKPRRSTIPLIGHDARAQTAPKRIHRELRLADDDQAAAYSPGQTLDVSVFKTVSFVDVIGISKGRGTAGVVKRHNMAVMRRTHGTHEATRHGGAIGAGSYPGRVLKGMKMPGRMGNSQVTSLNVEVVEVDADRSLLFVRGSVPGHLNGIVRVRPTVHG